MENSTQKQITKNVEKTLGSLLLEVLIAETTEEVTQKQVASLTESNEELKQQLEICKACGDLLSEQLTKGNQSVETYNEKAKQADRIKELEKETVALTKHYEALKKRLTEYTRPTPEHILALKKQLKDRDNVIAQFELHTQKLEQRLQDVKKHKAKQKIDFRESRDRLNNLIGEKHNRIVRMNQHLKDRDNVITEMEKERLKTEEDSSDGKITKSMDDIAASLQSVMATICHGKAQRKVDDVYPTVDEELEANATEEKIEKEKVVKTFPKGKDFKGEQS